MCGKSAQCRLDGAIGPSKCSARKERAFGRRPDPALRRPRNRGIRNRPHASKLNREPRTLHEPEVKNLNLVMVR